MQSAIHLSRTRPCAKGHEKICGECGSGVMESVKSVFDPTQLRKHLFYETSHSPSLADLVGYEKAKDIIDFCFIANPYYPTPEMLEDLKENFPNLIKSYPSSSPVTSQKNLAAVLHVNPDNLIIGNGATELIVLINTTLIRPHRRARPDVWRIHRKAQGPARRRALHAEAGGELPAGSDGLSCLGAPARAESPAHHQPRQSHRASSFRSRK